MKYILCLLLAGGISARVAPIESIVGPGAPCVGEECGDNSSNPCSLIKCRNGSHCVPRGTTGKCVLDSNPCSSIKCVRGYHCTVENGQGGCVSDVPSGVDLCSLVKCAIGSHCENGNCVSDTATEDPCRSIVCNRGYHCSVEQGGCVRDVPSEYDLCSQVKCAIGSRCKNGTCVPDAVTANPCNWIKCSLGYHCAVSNGGGGCVPDLTPIDSCHMVKCYPGSTCVVSNGEGNCVPDGIPINPCQLIQCPAGQKCVFGNKPATCVPDLTSSIGFAANF